MVKNGAKPITRILTDEEYIKALNEKLLEEVNEYLEDGNIEEIMPIKRKLIM